MRSREQDESLVNLSEISEIELIILRRLREFTSGDHRSQFSGMGFDFVGLREWQAGDRFSWIDWAQSSLTNFNPLIVREFEQHSTASVIAIADGSLSTRCGVDGVRIAAAVARAIATVGLSAVFFQDAYGLAVFEGRLEHFSAVRPRIGRGQVVHCIEAYEQRVGLQEVKPAESLSMTIGSFIRKTSLVPVISDFLFERPNEVLHELSLLNTTHDVFIVLVDSAFAFQMPRLSAGWIEAFDVETGYSRIMSRGELRGLARRVSDWQDAVERMSRDVGLDVLRLHVDTAQTEIALAEFVAERRLRRIQ